MAGGSKYQRGGVAGEKRRPTPRRSIKTARRVSTGWRQAGEATTSGDGARRKSGGHGGVAWRA